MPNYQKSSNTNSNNGSYRKTPNNNSNNMSNNNTPQAQLLRYEKRKDTMTKEAFYVLFYSF